MSTRNSDHLSVVLNMLSGSALENMPQFVGRINELVSSGLLFRGRAESLLRLACSQQAAQIELDAGTPAPTSSPKPMVGEANSGKK